MITIAHYIRPITIWSFLSWIGWLAVAILFMIVPFSPLISELAIIALLFSTTLIIQTPILGLYLLPLPLMIGPVLSFPIGGVGNATVGDLYSVVLILRTIIPRASRMNLASRPFILLGSVLLVFSALFSDDLGASMVALIKISQFALLIWVTLTLLEKPTGLQTIFSSWVLITTLCSVMLLWYLFNGQPGFLLNWASGREFGDDANYDLSNVLFRPAFFYTNFFLPLGLSLLYALIILLSNTETSRGMRMLLYVSLPINFVALVLNNTRSMLIPVISVGGLLIVLYFWRSLFRAKSHILKFVLLVAVVLGGIATISDSLISGAQLVALQQRGEDSSSIDMRLSVWSSTLSQTLDDPLRLLVVGWGPESTSRQGGGDIQRFLAGSLGNSEGAFDSTIIGFLVEYGVIFTTLVFAYIAVWFFRNLRLWRRTGDTIVLALLLMGVSLVFTHIFQQFGISPPALMAMQVFAFLPAAGRSLRVTPVAQHD